MPKITDPTFLIREFGGASVWTYNPGTRHLFCKVCLTSCPTNRKSTISQHVTTRKHQEKLKLIDFSAIPSCEDNLLASEGVDMESSLDEAIFVKDLTRMMSSVDIPFFKSELPEFQLFFNKYCSLALPSRQTLTRYIERESNCCLSRIKNILKGKNIFVVVEETADQSGRAFTWVLAGPLDGNYNKRPFLIDLLNIQGANNTNITQAINGALFNLLGKDLDCNLVRLLLTDGSFYCLKAGSLLKEMYPNLVHMICASHQLNRVAELAREEFPLVDQLICEVKHFFMTSPRRSKDLLVSIPPLPQTLLVKSETWLEAAFYYYDYYESLNTFMEQLNDEGVAFRKVKALFQTKELPGQLAAIKGNLVGLANGIKALRERPRPLVENLKIIYDVQSQLNMEPFSDELSGRLKLNPGMEYLQKIANIIEGTATDLEGMDINVPHLFKYAPIASLDCERIFSLLRDHLPEQQNTKSNEEHIRYLLIIQWNKSL
eukprot:TRINITY_DN18457_c0_g1_i1.p1 TRINITY_DN18457_c0_g1~~TRINITY_DN18457_c0_g1_i1.p1  ORF type:complete len:488 (-),score=44.37 TRINITY_DN18457_c0_g1_i1:312-1775(-)